MKFERGETEPGRLIADLKKGGMKELLESLAATADAAAGSGD